MDATWQALIANLAVVALFTSIWSQVSDWLDEQRWIVRKLCIGAMVGATAICAMLMGVEVAPGVVFDLRAGVMAVGAFFSGPMVGAFSFALAGGYRLFEGGAGALTGLVHLGVAVLIGLAVRMFARAPVPHPKWIVALGAGTSLLVLATAAALRGTVPDQALAEFMLPTTLLSFVATAIMGLAIRKARESGRERRILAAAMSQAPEFLYVKDREGRYLAANAAIVRHLGVASIDDVLGKTDFDLSPPERAQAFSEQDQAIMRTGAPLLDLEETDLGPAGNPRWFRTSKVPLRDEDGRIIGLAGMTVETTDLKKLEHDLIESRDRLSLALSEMSDGLAVFDAEGYLLFCNEQYRSAFPRSAHARVPGAHITDILRTVAETGEQLDVPEEDVEGWVRRVGALLSVPNVVTIEVADGRYLQLRNRPASNNTALVIVSDVTDIKLAERALIEANADLSRLAATDALTGLPNRRVFDETLARDMARTGRAGSPLGLILVDVDHFKGYNDTYGHQAGDRCLVMVAQAIKASLNRPTDLAARYGGEEFAVILPDTDADGAREVAERIRRAVSADSLAQLGTIGTRITASLGVAEYDLVRIPETPEDLIRRADAALYAAKAGGRDRVVVDPPRLHAVRRPST